MISMRLVAAVFATLCFAAPMRARATDIQITINAILVFQDEQLSGSNPSSSANYALDEGKGWATGYAGFTTIGSPPTHETATEIILEATTSDDIEVRTFAPFIQQWDFSDTDLGRVGSIQLRAKFDLNWNFDFSVSTSYSLESFVQYDKFDADSNFQLALGFFSCSTPGGQPTCFGSSGIDQSQLDISFNGVSWDIIGPVFLPFTAGMVNSKENYFGLSTGSSVFLSGGIAGDYVKSGAGNQVDLELTSPEASVTVTAVPEPALATLQSLALIVLAALRRHVHRTS